MPKDVIEIERDRILQKLRSECNRMSEWLHFNIPVAVHNPPSTSQDGATMCPDHIRTNADNYNGGNNEYHETRRFQ